MNKEIIKYRFIIIIGIIAVSSLAWWIFDRTQEKDNYILSKDEFLDQLELDEIKKNEELKFIFDGAIMDEFGNVKYRYKNKEKNKVLTTNQKEEYINILSKEIKLVYTCNDLYDNRNPLSSKNFVITKEFISIPSIALEEDKMNKELKAFKEISNDELYKEYLEYKEKDLVFNIGGSFFPIDIIIIMFFAYVLGVMVIMLFTSFRVFDDILTNYIYEN